MPEVNIKILNNNYRLLVSAGEEDLLRQCAKEVDDSMQAMRASSNSMGIDQVATLTALEIVYEARKAELAQKAEKEKAAQNEATCETSAPAPAVAQPAVAPVEAPPAPVATPSVDEINATLQAENLAKIEKLTQEAELTEAEFLSGLKELSSLCESALFKSAKIGAALF